VANHKSAEKRARQSKVRAERNQGIKSRARTLIKNVRTAVASGESENTEATLKTAEGALRKAASKGVFPKQRVSRQVSRLAKQRNKLHDA